MRISDMFKYLLDKYFYQNITETIIHLLFINSCSSQSIITGNRRNHRGQCDLEMDASLTRRWRPHQRLSDRETDSRQAHVDASHVGGQPYRPVPCAVSGGGTGVLLPCDGTECGGTRRTTRAARAGHTRQAVW